MLLTECHHDQGQVFHPQYKYIFTISEWGVPFEIHNVHFKNLLGTRKS